MAFGPLASTAWVGAHLEHDGLVVVDCRWYLGEPSRGREAYAAAHIPGAIYMDLEADLSAADGPGRHPLPDPAAFMETLGSKGIAPETVVVAYDDRSGAVAGRLWWMLRDLDHPRVAVLDGGLAAWPPGLLDAEPVEPIPHLYRAAPGHMPRIDRGELAANLASRIVLDARAADRYRGENEPVDPAAGHIPSAIGAELGGNLNEDGLFRSPAELAERFRSLGITDAASVVSSCGSGVTACHNILAMEVAGVGRAALYPGSWSDWSTAGMPIAVGPDPGRWPV